MRRDSPASRHAKRSQIVMGAIAMAMFAGLPMWILIETMEHDIPAAFFLVYFFGAVVGFVWMNWVTCPKCGALITKLYTVMSPSSVKSECARCGRSTSIPYERVEV